MYTIMYDLNPQERVVLCELITSDFYIAEKHKSQGEPLLSE